MCGEGLNKTDMVLPSWSYSLGWKEADGNKKIDKCICNYNLSGRALKGTEDGDPK